MDATSSTIFSPASPKDGESGERGGRSELGRRAFYVLAFFLRRPQKTGKTGEGRGFSGFGDETPVLPPLPLFVCPTTKSVRNGVFWVGGLPVSDGGGVIV